MKLSSILCVLTAFVIKVCTILSNAFPASVEMSTWVLFFMLLTWCVTLTEFHSLCRLHSLTVCNTLMCCWIQFASVLWELLHLCSWKALVCSFVSWNVFVWLWCQGDTGVLAQVSSVPSSYYFGKLCEGLVLILQTFSRIHNWSHLGLDFSSCEVLKLVLLSLCLLQICPDFPFLFSPLWCLFLGFFCPFYATYFVSTQFCSISLQFFLFM